MASVTRRRRRLFFTAALPISLLVLTDQATAVPPTEPPPPETTTAPSATAAPTTAAPADTTPPPAPPTVPDETPPPSEPAPPETEFTAEPLTPTDTFTAGKSPTSALAETDPELLARDDAEPVEVLIKLDYDSVATYSGAVAGLDATSPAVTGEPLTGNSPAEQAYEGFIVEQEATFEAALDDVAPTATVGQPIRTVYGGVRAVLPANEVEDVLGIANVVAVQIDALNQLLTDSSTDFIGAPTIYNQLGGDTNAGEGVIFGVLDSGAWPEHLSFADQGNLGAPPAAPDGRPRRCDFGDNPLTPAADPFVCQNKLIGGEAFLAAYLSSPSRAAAEPFKTARDSNGHGTHTGSTAAGNVLPSAPVFGVDRGPVQGVAPGAWVSVYKVCGIQGCFSSDSASAVERAILDGVDVINFSISGGTSPFTDPVELAFLDAYAAGVFVAASAGNSGPAAGTANHVSAWTTTVAASTQTREFRSSLTVTAGANTFQANGASITAGAGPHPVVLSSAAPYSNARCTVPAPAGLFEGKIVACERGGNARVDKGYNVLQGGAEGMILYNLPPTTDVETDNHWLPTVHLVNGTELVAFLNANPGATAQFTAGVRADGQGDVMASFSSRGPAGNFIKPDITAPGVQILAGHTPVRESISQGPPGEYFQAIAGTSMSSPHIAGSAILVEALHPDWTPGQVKSAMMTTATTNVVKEDGSTPADPFDHGAGRVDLNLAGNPGLTIDETAARMIAFANDPENAVHLNLPSVNAPTMPGRLVTTRTVENVGSRNQGYNTSATAPAGSSITVEPRGFTVRPGQTQVLTITIESDAAVGSQVFGQIVLEPRGGGRGRPPTLHLPVAFVPQQGGVALTSDCDPDTIPRGSDSFCEITAQNQSMEEITVDLRTTVNRNLEIVAARNATLRRGQVEKLDVVLQGEQPGLPSVDPGELFGYIPLSAFGAPIPIGDEQIINFNVPSYVYNGVTYSSIGVTSNGYLVAGGGTSTDIECCNLPAGPDPSPPNNFLAPFWTDLDGAGAPGIYANVLGDGVNSWIVVEWGLNVYGTTSLRTFQTWIGIGETQDITYAYPAPPPAAPVGQPYLFGAENEFGQGDVVTGPPTEDQRVTSTDPAPGDSVTYGVAVRGRRTGNGEVRTEMTSTDIPGGTTVVTSTVVVQ